MERITDLHLLGGRDQPVFLAAGFLDGLHLGHQAVLNAAIEEARTLEAEAWVLTVDPHPMKILRPDRAPAVLTDLTSRLRLLSRTGVTGCVVLPFTEALSVLEPEAFLDELLRCVPRLRGLVVGQNWRFGHRARGDVSLLREWAEKHDLHLRVLAPVLCNGIPISSTRIRQAIESGNIPEATTMLGRPFSISGTVVHGRSLGRQLGFPTANLLPLNEVRPAPGVYAVRVSGIEPAGFGAAYYGGRPTFDDGRPAGLEIHLLDIDRDLYGMELEAHFLERLRGDIKFERPEDLLEQIRKDVTRVRNLTARTG
jgi:riboflavin kinase/FMN adenylyltransferase